MKEEYWSNRYAENKTGWDIGYAGPLAKIIDQIEDKNATILIPGCGNGYEAEYALQRGFKNIHVIDITSEPLENLKSRCPEFPDAQLIHVDFFKHEGNYDFILEQTFFCALPPEMREDYALKMHELLNENGILTGVMFDFPLESGPPFGGSLEEYNQLFSRKFDIEIMERCSFSIEPRMGKELHVKFRKKSHDRR